MNARLIQRSGLPLMIGAAVVLLLGSLGVVLVFDPFGFREASPSTTDTATDPEVSLASDVVERSPSPQPMTEPQSESTTPPLADDEAAEPANPSSEAVGQPADDAAVRESAPSEQRQHGQQGVVSGDQPLEIARSYSVRTGDTLFDISGAQWGDPYAWPLILLANESTVVDPDMLSDPDRRLMATAHLLAYTRYRELGLHPQRTSSASRYLGPIRINKSLWVLYSGLRYNRDLVDQLRDRLEPYDAAKVEEFVARFGYPPDPPEQ
jgi:hypothetical protein